MWNVSYAPIITKLTQVGNLPYFFAVGNHDVSGMPVGDPGRAQGLENTLTALSNLIPPEGSPRRLRGYPTYAVGYGNVFVLAIDSNIAADPLQLSWVTAQLDVANPRCRQVVSTQVARSAIDAARCPVGDRSDTSRCESPGTAQNVRGIVGKPVAGKSGTTDGEKTASLVVMTKQLAVAGILADPDWAQTSQRMDHDFVNPAVYNTVREAARLMKRRGCPSSTRATPGRSAPRSRHRGADPPAIARSAAMTRGSRSPAALVETPMRLRGAAI